MNVPLSFLSLSPYLKVTSRLSCLTLYNPMDCSPPGSSVHGISQVRILEFAISFSRASSQCRDQRWVSCIGRQILYHLSHRGSPSLSPYLEVTSRLCIPASHISRLPCWSQLSRAWCVQWISSHLRFLTGSMFGSFIKPSTHGHCWFSPWNDPDLPTLRVSASLSLTFSVCVCFLGRLLSSTGIQSKGFAIFQGQFAPQRKAKSIFCLKGLFAF